MHRSRRDWRERSGSSPEEERPATSCVTCYRAREYIRDDRSGPEYSPATGSAVAMSRLAPGGPALCLHHGRDYNFKNRIRSEAKSSPDESTVEISEDASCAPSRSCLREYVCMYIRTRGIRNATGVPTPSTPRVRRSFDSGSATTTTWIRTVRRRRVP